MEENVGHDFFGIFRGNLFDVDAIRQFDNFILSLNIKQIQSIIFDCIRDIYGDSLEQIFRIYRQNNALPKIQLESKECIYDGFAHISHPYGIETDYYRIKNYHERNINAIKRLMNIIVDNVEYANVETTFLNNSELFSYWLELNPSILQNPKTVFESIVQFFHYNVVRFYSTPEVIRENLYYILIHQQVPYNYLIDYAIDYRNESIMKRESDKYLNNINKAINFIEKNKGTIEESLYSFDAGLYDYLDEPHLRNIVQTYHTRRDSGFCSIM